MINEVDDDGSGSIDFKEFLVLMAKKIKDADTEEELLESFRVFDVEGKGRITIKDIITVLRQLGERFTDEEIEEMVKGNDQDLDGTLSYEEFCRMIAN